MYTTIFLKSVLNNLSTFSKHWSRNRMLKMNLSVRCNVSFLFAPRFTSENLKNVPSILNPKVDYFLNSDNIAIIKNSLKTREMKNVDLETMISQLQQLSALKSELETSDEKRQHLKGIINEKVNQGASSEEIEEKIVEGRKLRSEHRKIVDSMIKLEDDLIPKLLDLPNKLDPKVPVKCTVKETSSIEQPNFNFTRKDHVELCSESQNLKFSGITSGAYYLTGRLASLELAILDYFAEQYLKNDFTRISNPDICKSIVVEGCGFNINDSLESFQLEEDSHSDIHLISTQHLTGSASLSSFCALFSKKLITGSNLPLKYFSVGRSYIPEKSNSAPSLLNNRQNSSVYFFVACKDNSSLLFENALDILNSSFKMLELHYRMIEIGAPKLLPNESRRNEIQMWSPSTQMYKAVATVSDYSDYIAKRLWMCYKDGSNNKFVNVIGGTSISVPPFLACLVENCQMQNGDFQIPTALESYITRFY